MGEIDKEQKSLQTVTLAVVLLTNLVAPFAIASMNVAAPQIGVEFDASATSLTWIILAYLLVTAIFSVPFGRLSDIKGRRKIFKIGLGLFFVASVFIIFSPSMAVFILLRILQGIGAAMIFSTNLALLVDVFPADKRGGVLGIAISCVYIGQSAGPVIGGFITHAFGWRAVFIVISALAFVSLITAMARFPKEDIIKDENQTIKTSSVILFILSLGLLLYGIATLMQNIWSYFILAAGIVLLLIYVRLETRSDAPLLEVRLFKGNRAFSFALLAVVFNYAAVFSITYLMSLYLQLARGFTADISGLILICQPIIQAALSPVAGRLSDKKPPSHLASFGMACCATALFMFAFVNEQTPIPYIMAGLFLTGLGIAFFSSPNLNVIMSSVSSKDYGVATSLNTFTRTFGQVMGMALLSLIIHLTIGDIPIAEVKPAALIYDMRVSFIVFAVICVAGIMVSLQRNEKKVGL